MIRPLWQIERLRQLLAEQEAEAMQSQYPQPSPKVTVGKPQLEDKPSQVTLNHDPDVRPKCIEGLTLGEILLLEADGGLPQEAQDWLSYRTIPNLDGSWRPPNLKAIMRRAQRKSETN